MTDYRPQAWSRPPENVRPGTVALDLVLASNGDVDVVVPRAEVYLENWTFDVRVVLRESLGLTDHPSGLMHRGPGDSDMVLSIAGEAGSDPVGLSPSSFGGTALAWGAKYFMWPLPHPDARAVTFSLVWPELGVAPVTVDVDAALIHAAAARAVELWPDERPLRPPPEPGATNWDAYAAD